MPSEQRLFRDNGTQFVREFDTDLNFVDVDGVWYSRTGDNTWCEEKLKSYVVRDTMKIVSGISAAHAATRSGVVGEVVLL